MIEDCRTDKRFLNMAEEIMSCTGRANQMMVLSMLCLCIASVIIRIKSSGKHQIGASIFYAGKMIRQYVADIQSGESGRDN